MKKRLVAFCCICVLFGCHKERNNDSKDVTYKNVSTNVEIELYKGVSSYPLLKTVIHNCTDEDLMTGEYFELDNFEDNKWRNVSLKRNVAFHDIGIVLKKGESKDFTYELKLCFGHLRKGRYRIKQSFMNDLKEKKEVYKEFDIK